MKPDSDSMEEGVELLSAEALQLQGEGGRGWV